MTDPRRLLVIANETVEGAALHDAIRSRAREGAIAVVVVAPALNSRLRHWMSDSDAARRAAEERLVACLERIADRGFRASGGVSDADPLQAIEDALSVCSVDELIIETQPEDRTNWLAHDIVEQARSRFGLPVAHVVVEL